MNFQHTQAIKAYPVPLMTIDEATMRNKDNKNRHIHQNRNENYIQQQSPLERRIERISPNER